MNAATRPADRDTRLGREEARAYLQAKIEGQRRHLADPHGFATISPNYLIADAEHRLRWIDCAPDGARFCVAPLQDKRGVPMGGVFSENLGPGKNLRDAYAARGLHPLGGAAHRAWLAQSQGEQITVAP